MSHVRRRRGRLLADSTTLLAATVIAAADLSPLILGAGSADRGASSGLAAGRSAIDLAPVAGSADPGLAATKGAAEESYGADAHRSPPMDLDRQSVKTDTSPVTWRASRRSPNQHGEPCFIPTTTTCDATPTRPVDQDASRGAGYGLRPSRAGYPDYLRQLVRLVGAHGPSAGAMLTIDSLTFSVIVDIRIHRGYRSSIHARCCVGSTGNSTHCRFHRAEHDKRDRSVFLRRDTALLLAWLRCSPSRNLDASTSLIDHLGKRRSQELCL